MTASELYELVKDDGGVWERLIDWSSMMRRWYPSSDGAAGGLPSELVELILESAYARALLVSSPHNICRIARFGEGGNFDVNGDICPTLIEALVAAYRAGKEKK